MPMAIHATSTFAALGRAELKAEGYPGNTLVTTPHPLAGIGKAAIRRQAENAVDQIIEILTQDQNVAEVTQEAVYNRIEITGRDHLDAYEQFNQLFLNNHWGDGLPLVPPTREKVDWMLAGLDLPPDEMIVTARPSGRVVTAEALAVCAVMAGALPAYMPVIAAALKAFDQIPWGWGSVTTTSSVAPVIIVNGPIAKQLDINAKNNAIGYGWRANATIGRAIEMVFHCVGQAIPGISDMSTLGLATTFTSTVFAEDIDVLDDLKWTTFAEDRGFDREANVVSVSVAMGGYKAIFHYEAQNAEDGMQKILWSAKPLNFIFKQNAMFLLNPEFAKVFAKSGWKRRDLMEQIAARGHERWKAPTQESLTIMDWSRSWRVGEGGPKWFQDLPDDYPLSIFPSDPNDVWLFVAGGSGKESHFYPGLKAYTDIQSRAIELPDNWDRILAGADIPKTLTNKLPKLPW